MNVLVGDDCVLSTGKCGAVMRGGRGAPMIWEVRGASGPKNCGLSWGDLTVCFEERGDEP